MFTGTNEDLRASQGIVAIVVMFCPCANQAKVRAALRFGQTHGAGPLAARQTGQIKGFQFGTAKGVERAVGASGEPGVHTECHIGRTHHFFNQNVERTGHTLTAVFGRTSQSVPAALDVFRIGFLETSRGRNFAVIPLTTFLITGSIQWEQFVLAEFGRFF